MEENKENMPADEQQEKMDVDPPEGDDGDDTEGMDMKARALAKLLKTSSVSTNQTIASLSMQHGS
jgi:hypothetical protein